LQAAAIHCVGGAFLGRVEPFSKRNDNFARLIPRDNSSDWFFGVSEKISDTPCPAASTLTHRDLEW
jgi:hypothetical protein